jgi:hypothetical protein
MEKTSDNGFIIAGYIDPFWNEQGPIKDSILVIKVNASGEKEWRRTYCNGQYSQGFSIATTPENGYIVCGMLDTGIINHDQSSLWLLHLKPNGDTLWTKTYGDSSNFGCSIINIGNNKYVVVGDDGIIFQIKDDAASNAIKNPFVNNSKEVGRNLYTAKSYAFDLLGRRTIIYQNQETANSNRVLFQKIGINGTIKKMCTIK